MVGELAADIISCRPGVGGEGLRVITFTPVTTLVDPRKQSHPAKLPASKSIFGGQDWEYPSIAPIIRMSVVISLIA